MSIIKKSGNSSIEKSLAQMLKTQEKELSKSKEKPVVCLICDCSGSMAEMAKTAPKIEVLAKSVSNLQTSLASTYRIRIIMFNHDAVFVDRISPYASGGTALHLALRLAKSVKPDKIIVLSDGLPDYEEKALNEAMGLKCPISCIYIGPEGGSGFAFLQKLASCNSGQFDFVDLKTSSGTRHLEGKIKGMLPG
jgi:hypothetical protein